MHIIDELGSNYTSVTLAKLHSIWSVYFKKDLWLIITHLNTHVPLLTPLSLPFFSLVHYYFADSPLPLFYTFLFPFTILTSSILPPFLFHLFSFFHFIFLNITRSLPARVMGLLQFGSLPTHKCTQGCFKLVCCLHVNIIRIASNTFVH